MSKTFRLAIDVGGTFTDVVVVDDADASLRFGKVLSTPDDLARGSLAGADETLKRSGIAPSRVAEVIHATTAATNALLERNGANTGLITTRGFRDTLEMGRESRYDIYDLGLRLPAPLVPRRLRVEVDERLDHDGKVLRPLEESSVKAAVDLLLAAQVKSIAICLLHSHVNPLHEQRLVELVRRLAPGVEISVSHEVAGEAREFERTSTVVVDAYVKPLVRRYIERLAEGLGNAGLPGRPAMMLSHGGIGSAIEVANRFPARMIESGPAAGAIAAAYFARQALAAADAVAFDMGGTTAKMSLVQGGTPAVTHEYEVAHVQRFKHGSGIPLQISAIELLEIGAGGGSIAQLNELGLLTVGPRSAGAIPGPACYGGGGKQPTVTDADLVLGYLDPEHFLGGDMKLDAAASRSAIDEHLARSLGMTVEALAWGIHDIVNENMTAAIRAHAAKKGVDLRRFGLVAFGGAGPLHAYAIARKLGISRVVCPFGAGVGSAIGCLVATPAADLVATYVAPLPEADWPLIRERFYEMERNARGMIESLVGAGADTLLRPSFEMRCEGQGYSVIVEAPPGSVIEQALGAELQSRFTATYEQLYGHGPPQGVPLEIISLRARVEHPREVPQLRLWRTRAAQRALKGTRQVYFEAARGYAETKVYDRYALPTAEWFEGPAIIEERETSIVVGPDARFRQEESGHIVIELGEREDHQAAISTPAALDPIGVEILWTRAISVVDEAALTLHRTSFSTVVRESHDYTCMILDPNGQAVAQATRSVPSFIGTLPMSVRAFLEKYPAETLRPGDVILSNDPWIGTGHLPDLTLAAPIFHHGRLVGFAGAIAHMSDIGGRRRAPDNRDIYEEGLQIPILKLYEAGRLNETLMAIIRRNVRVPAEVTGDIHAMVGAAERMGQGVSRLLTEYGLDDLQPLAAEVIGRTEAAMRRAIAAIPDGEYRSTTMIDSFDSRAPLRMDCTIVVKGDGLKADFAGSSPQNHSPLNAVLGYTRAYSTYALKCVLLPEVPNNEGNVSPIEITAPEGCFLNPRYPAAVEARATVGHYTTSAVLTTLAKALPERVPAESAIPLHGFTIRGRSSGKPFSSIFFFSGGQGARPDQDGLPTLSFPTNVSNTPVEVLERLLPVRIHEKVLLPNSGGRGRYRGGPGQRVRMEIVGTEGANLVLLSQRLNFPPLGRQGGENGSLERISLNGEAVQGGKPFELGKGDVFTLELPGGGGFGRKEERDPRLAAQDRENGIS